MWQLAEFCVFICVAVAILARMLLLLLICVWLSRFVARIVVFGCYYRKKVGLVGFLRHVQLITTVAVKSSPDYTPQPYQYFWGFRGKQVTIVNDISHKKQRGLLYTITEPRNRRGLSAPMADRP